MPAATRWSTNFIGLDDLGRIGEEVVIRASFGDDVWELSAESNRLQCPSDIVSDLGFDLLLPASFGEIGAACDAAGIDPDKVSVILIGEDGFLKERSQLLESTLAEIGNERRVVGEGERRPRTMMNSLQGFALELSFILGEEGEAGPGRPHRWGTKLYSRIFTVKPYSDPDGLSPVELTKEVIQDYHLSQRTQVFVEVKEALLESDSIDDALTIHLDSKLLRGIKARRTGLEYDYLTTSLAINALQQVVFELSKELGEDSGREAAADLPPVLAMVVARLQEVRRIGAKTMSADQAIELIATEPQVAAALLTGLQGMTPDARKLIKDAGDSE
jgi:hypothetical protein